MRKAKIIVPVLSFLFVLSLLIYDATYGKMEEKSLFSMNTLVSLKVYGPSEKDITEKIEDKLNSLDADILSRFSESSKLSELNRDKKTDSKDLVKWISTLYEISDFTEGIYDISIGSVSDLWNFSDKCGLPDSELLKDAVAKSGYRNVKIKSDEVYLLNDEVKIDLGSAGKGIALDEIRKVLSSEKIHSAVISVGGSILLYGNKKFTVGIRDPFGNNGKYIATVQLNNKCVSTSGVYEQCFEMDGKLYHHIIDPQTGYPVDNGLLSCTVISDNGLLSDALSTACFVLGINQGTDLANKYGCHVIFVDNQKRIHTDEETGKLLSITDSTYILA